MRPYFILLILFHSFFVFGQGKGFVMPISGMPPITYAKLNPSYIAGVGDGLDATDLIYTVNSGYGSRCAIATIGKSTGKYYWEFYLTTYTSLKQIMIGLANASHTANTALGLDAGLSWGVGAAFSTPYKLYNGGYTTYGVAWSVGDIISVAANFSSHAFDVYQNGTIVGSSPAFSSLSGTLYPGISNVSSDGFVVTANFGQNAWDSRTSSLRTTLSASGYTIGLY